MNKRCTLRNLVMISLLFVLLGLITPNAFASTQLKERVEEIVAAEARYDLFSGVVLVAEHGEIIYAKGIGEANKEHHNANSLATRFNISSVQKCFIATLIMQLVQAGEIALEDPLTKYFPDCPYPTANEIQIQHLLNHSSGLADYRDSEQYKMHVDEFKSIDDVLPLVYELEPAFAPGAGFEYSNAGVLYLKAIIERTTGSSLETVLTERIFQPLGMDDTVLFVGGELLADRATGHQRAADGETIVRVLGEPSAYAGGGIYTTAGDLLAFDQALYGEELLNGEHKSLMFTPSGPNPSVAYGWFVIPYGGTTVVMHSGGSGGFASEFRRYPEKGYTLIVLSNYAWAGFELTNTIEAFLLGLPYEVATEANRWYRKGMDLQRVDEYRQATVCFEKNIEILPLHMPSLYQAARSRILGEYEQAKAIELLDRYIELADENTQPSTAAACWRKGVAYEQLNEVKKAIACYRESLDHDETFSQAQEALQKLEKSE